MPKEKAFTFGTCRYEHTSPKRERLSAKTKVLNVILTFGEALKLDLAVDECVRKLNKYKMSGTEGKHAVLNLAIHLGSKRIAVNKGKLKRKQTIRPDTA